MSNRILRLAALVMLVGVLLDSAVVATRASSISVDSASAIGLQEGRGTLQVKRRLAPAYYVAGNGNDANPGTEAQPWLTIQKAANGLQAGETVYVKAGTYYEKVDVMNSGSAGNYITFAAYPGDTVNIDGTHSPLASYEGLINIVGKSYVVIDGFNFQNALAEGAGIHVTEANYVVIRNNNFVSRFGASAIKIGFGPTYNILVENNVIDRTRSPTCSTWPNACWAEMISISDSHGVVIRGNHIRYNEVGEGIDLKDGTTDAKVYNNIVENTAAVGIYVDARGIMRNIEIYNNIVHTPGEDGVVLNNERFTGGATIQNVSMYNNIVYGCGMGLRIGPYGLWLNPGEGLIKDVRVTNNLFYGNADGNDIGLDSKIDLQNVVIRNNIFYRNSISIRSGTVSADHNLFDDPSSCIGTDCVIGDPKLMNPSGADFHLQVTSSAIDAGSAAGAPTFDLDAKARPQGAGLDIGPYEFS